VTAPADGSARAFHIRQGDRDIGNEVYRWTGHTLDCTVDVPAVGRRIVARTSYDESFEPIEYQAQVYQLDTTDLMQTIRIRFDADGVSWVTTGANSNSGSRPLPKPRAIVQNLVFSHLVALVERGPVREAGSETFQAFLVDSGQAIDVVARRDGTMARVNLAGIDFELTLAADGTVPLITTVPPGLSIEATSPDAVSASRPLVPVAQSPPPVGVVEEPIGWSNGAQQISGTLTRPAAGGTPVPVGLIIAGSGPTDRDGNSALGVKTDFYRKLAWALATEGVASVRYDKRGLGKSVAAASASLSTFDDFADDASEGARTLAADSRFSRVVLIGHSEGAGLATRAANRGAPVVGVVMLAGLGRPFLTVLREQLGRQLDAAQIEEFERVMQAYLADGPMPEVPAGLAVLFPRPARRFVQTAVAIDPVDEARRVAVPLMIGQGAMDVQVGVTDAEQLAAAHPSARLVVFPNANHLFVRAEKADLASQAASYTDPTQPIVPDLVPALVRFITGLDHRASA
jgi:hypothetical protein